MIYVLAGIGMLLMILGALLIADGVDGVRTTELSGDNGPLIGIAMLTFGALMFGGALEKL